VCEAAVWAAAWTALGLEFGALVFVARPVRRMVPVARRRDPGRLLISEGGRLPATSLLQAMLLLVGVDVVFAVDSLPAIQGVTAGPFTGGRLPAIPSQRPVLQARAGGVQFAPADDRIVQASVALRYSNEPIAVSGRIYRVRPTTVDGVRTRASVLPFDPNDPHTLVLDNPDTPWVDQGIDGDWIKFSAPPQPAEFSLHEDATMAEVAERLRELNPDGLPICDWADQCKYELGSDYRPGLDAAAGFPVFWASGVRFDRGDRS
jgi:hypothetical protein